jgi:hypothetical protein
MNDWRRGLLAGYSLLLVGFSVLMIVLAWNEGRQLDIDLGGFRLVSFIDTGGANRVLFTGLMFFIAWFALITFVVALVADRPRYRDTLVVRMADGKVTLTADMVATMIREEVERLPSVRQAFVAVRFNHDRVEPDITLVLEPGSRVDHTVNAVQITTRETLGDRFGISVLPAGISLASGVRPGDERPYAPPPPPLAVRRLVRPNDGNLEFPVDDGV